MLRFTHLAQGRSCSPILLHVLNVVLRPLIKGLSKQESYQIAGHMLHTEYQSQVQLGQMLCHMAEENVMLSLGY